MRVVVDTNILIRALIKPQGTVGPVLSRLRNDEYILVYSAPMFDELVEKLALPRIRHKYHLEKAQIEALIALIALRGVLVIPDRKIKVCRDPDDDMFTDAALAGGAEYVVTGDTDLLTLERFETVRFVTPRTFLAAF
jgi:uncharacterized protein